MRVLVLTAAEVESLLPMPQCIEVMAEALAGLARGEALQPLRLMLAPPGAAGLMAFMPAYAGGDAPAFALKAIGIFHGNAALGKDAHQGATLLFDGRTGELRAVMNAAAITAIRTAAVSAVATRLLAREDAVELAIVGAGVQARTHVEALAAVLPLRRVRIASRSGTSAELLAHELRGRYSFPVEAAHGAEAAVRGADVVVTATSAPTPVIAREWLAAGVHINAIGASQADRREIDSATVAAARLYVDRRESAHSEAGDYLIPLREGAIQQGHIRAELGELLTGTARGRTAPSEMTLFKSLGLAVEDLAAAAFVFQQASATRAGTWVEF